MCLGRNNSDESAAGTTSDLAHQPSGEVFGACVRAATTDAHVSNIAAEQSIGRARGVDTGGALHLLCGIHATALVYKKTLHPLDDDVSSAIQVALSLRNGAAMTRFRAALREEIATRLKIYSGRAPRAATQYKRNVLRIFCAPGDTSDSRRALLALIPNGEWRSPYVEYYVRPGGQFSIGDRDAILSHLTDGITLALASSQPAVYNRSRWAGSDVAVNDLGLFEAAHRLLSSAYARFAAGYLSGAQANQYLDAVK